MRWLSVVACLAMGTNALSIPSWPIEERATKNCPTNLSGAFEFPHLIIPVNSSAPKVAKGTSYYGEVSSTISSIFNFDIPTQGPNLCTLVFLFPSVEGRPAWTYTFEGDGKVGMARLEAPANDGTTFENAPKVAAELGTSTLAAGTSTVVTSFDCPFGQRIAFKMSNAGNTNLKYFQDYGNPPIGLYITRCAK
ncbi:hypothetical protein McanMca71_003356 [Microsporum canis]|uniref:Ubiquitin 3 binding protein But2 C-terminal domain-containing protein n=1 Tax=Arthroderma otae (strain ATCC MYA-4605 / CBS 113480) TaxID=554155 RepID=C5FSC7_ARTOC|nr:conserved hypothetical protein [Microsporum canis CBS 113480]EEQ32780.1 conserved hypothetical protein [Microsporum canis CBS 113480]